MGDLEVPLRIWTETKLANNLVQVAVKEGVIFKSLRPEIYLILPTLSAIFAHFKRDCVITSANDGKHKDGSLHYKDLALDLRSKHLLDLDEKNALKNALSERLGIKYRVLFENIGTDNEHYHIQFIG